MTTIMIKIDDDGAGATLQDNEDEYVTVLREAVEDIICAGAKDGTLRDSNGNRVGEFSIGDDE